ncbi:MULTISPECIES: hemerythrin domain-containing protein [Halomonadaceae]|uniref:hemerythrin domain-containing protein n=1 Tax=Halomonadaceae TaxID=28256 RepID=UPI000C338F64|nr:hemerythrin domain-containing protein [Halomonas sp. MES3-P3E]PKG54648.1 cation-binding protein [Halomonas sp. MES3-P3E]|tara:strand:+ start:1976 stop:2551 length:576 start_codon:yes stop_codon:yes gene_type:complete
MTQHNTNGSAKDVVDILTTDHQEMMALAGQIKGSNDPQWRRDTADTLIAEVMRHAIAEEMYVYPAIEKYIPNGTEEVEHDKQEHDEIVQVMKQLEDCNAVDPVFMTQLEKLEGLLSHHADDEESQQFPKMRTRMSGDQLIELGEKLEQAKTLAPTRPHPNAPHSELFHKSVGAGVGMVDRLRDKLTGRKMK